MPQSQHLLPYRDFTVRQSHQSIHRPNPPYLLSPTRAKQRERGQEWETGAHDSRGRDHTMNTMVKINNRMAQNDPASQQDQKEDQRRRLLCPEVSTHHQLFRQHLFTHCLSAIYLALRRHRQGFQLLTYPIRCPLLWRCKQCSLT